MNFWQAIASGITNYVTFAGRASRSEFWYWCLFTVLGGLITGILDSALFGMSVPGTSPLNGIFNLALFLPSLAMGVRRLHDIDRTGWWYLITLTIIGFFLLLFWAFRKGTDGPNRFGPDPLAGTGTVTPRPAV